MQIRGFLGEELSGAGFPATGGDQRNGGAHGFEIGGVFFDQLGEPALIAGSCGDLHHGKGGVIEGAVVSATVPGGLGKGLAACPAVPEVLRDALPLVIDGQAHETTHDVSELKAMNAVLLVVFMGGELRGFFHQIIRQGEGADMAKMMREGDADAGIDLVIEERAAVVLHEQVDDRCAADFAGAVTAAGLRAGGLEEAASDGQHPQDGGTCSFSFFVFCPEGDEGHVTGTEPREEIVEGQAEQGGVLRLQVARDFGDEAVHALGRGGATAPELPAAAHPLAPAVGVVPSIATQQAGLILMKQLHAEAEDIHRCVDEHLGQHLAAQRPAV